MLYVLTVSGPACSGKSLAVLGGAIAYAKIGKVVWYFDCEMSEEALKKRIAMLRGRREDPALRQMYFFNHTPGEPRDLVKLLTHEMLPAPDLVVFDPLDTLLGDLTIKEGEGWTWRSLANRIRKLLPKKTQVWVTMNTPAGELDMTGFTLTGRLVREPRMQNIPLNTEVGRKLRAALRDDLFARVPGAGDVSGIEEMLRQPFGAHVKRPRKPPQEEPTEVPVPKDDPLLVREYAKLMSMLPNCQVVKDGSVYRFKRNRLYRWLSDRIDLNELWISYYNKEVRLKEIVAFYQGMGYSLSGFEEVFGGLVDLLYVDKLAIDEIVDDFYWNKE